eukprot:4669873-Prymnesium_polylepis.1
MATRRSGVLARAWRQQPGRRHARSHQADGTAGGKRAVGAAECGCMKVATWYSRGPVDCAPQLPGCDGRAQTRGAQ